MQPPMEDERDQLMILFQKMQGPLGSAAARRDHR